MLKGNLAVRMSAVDVTGSSDIRRAVLIVWAGRARAAAIRVLGLLELVGPRPYRELPTPTTACRAYALQAPSCGW